MNDKIPYINKADDVAFYYIYLLAFNDGLDYRILPDETKRMKELYDYAKRRVYYFDDHKIQWCIEKYQYKNRTLKELNDEFKGREFWKTYHVNMNIVCCNSCHSGSSSTPFKDIEEQRIKYGEYICKRCEENSLIAGQTQDLKDSLKRKLMLAKSGLYHDEGVRPKGSKWLGFAGSWFLIKTKDRIWLTNNLFVTTELHEKLLKNFEHNINCEIYGVYYWQDIEKRLTTEEFEKLKDTIGFKYFINEYNYEFMDREYNKKTL